MIVIDVREPDEFAAGHAKGAVNVPLGQIGGSEQIAKLNKTDKIVVYCNSGNRSEYAKNIMEQQGFNNVTNAINQQTLKTLII